MRNRLPAVVRQARDDADNAAEQLRQHLKMCGLCARSHRCQQYARMCDTGWAHLKYKRRTAAALIATEKDYQASLPQQLALL